MKKLILSERVARIGIAPNAAARAIVQSHSASAPPSIGQAALVRRDAVADQFELHFPEAL